MSRDVNNIDILSPEGIDIVLRALTKGVVAESELQVLLEEYEGHLLSEIERDHQTWARVMFPNYVKGPFADFHDFTWQWFWDLKLNVPSDALLKIVSRFFAKSTTVQMGLISCAARKTRGYALYISETQKQADDHVTTIGSMLECSNLGLFYPALAARKTGKYGSSQGWRRSRFWTDDGFIVDAVGLDTATRGIKLEERRPDIMIFDDIDSKHDSPGVIDRKIKIITTSLMPAGDPQACAYVFAQNMIHKDGVIAQIYDGRQKILRKRRCFGVVPAIRNFTWDTDADGFPVITGGEPSWEWMTLDKLQVKLDEIGIDAFLTECQHEVNTPMAGAIFGEFNEVYHVITDSEFADGWARITGEELERGRDGRIKMPYMFTIGRYQDVGTTKGHPTVVSWWSRPPEISGHADLVFTHRERVFPRLWWDSKEVFEAFSPGTVAEEIFNAEMKAAERHRIDSGNSWLSHETGLEKRAYELDVPEEHRIFWQKWKGDFRAMRGVGVMKTAMTINRKQPHLFRRYPAGHELAGQPLPGMPKMLMIVADGQGELFMDENGQMRVRSAIDADGLRRARWEIPQYRLHENIHGEEAGAPKRIHDDWISTAKAAAVNHFPQPKRRTAAEQVVFEVENDAPALAEESIAAMPADEQPSARFRRDMEIENRLYQRQRSTVVSRMARLRMERSNAR